ncbi:hypothetical protein QZH41_020253 [Actinostola sp. cb2023]|nr:hypothetical protein QZH41_020253 [Actinostola sp. cb2023]
MVFSELHQFPDSNGQYKCELLNTTVHNVPSKQTSNNNFHHFAIQTKCLSNPCENNGVCIPVYTDDTYTCKCPNNFFGDHCEMVADKYAVCSNIQGSHVCTCKAGFQGNGNTCTAGGLEKSTILDQYGNANYFTTVLQSSSTSRWVRCWHASVDGWDVKKTFHPQCDGKGPTVTIVRVGQFVFGGYTDVSWHSRPQFSQSSRSFLYSLYNIKGYQPLKLNLTGKDNHQAIRGGFKYGPIFGGGYDLYIPNHAASNKYSCTNPFSYQPPPGCFLSQPCSFVTGSFKFTPNDVEVFYEII